MNLANKLTVFRVFLVPIFIIAFYSNFQNTNILAAIIFLIASLTDTLDGYIARKYNLITNFGKFMDPLADKVLVITAMILLVEKNVFPGWILAIVIAREFIVSGIRMMASLSNIAIAAGKTGKLKTATQMFAVILMLLDNFPFGINGFRLDLIFLYISTILTVISGLEYIIKNKEVLNN
ncbi:MAG: CDP-diacylglycerol--glycerol-3-phosphate 3-phosphatidyltransferase [Tissierellia bacterium]|nr:CDP-diacylglycerol--glycerol-3-phosphate 3-phosphatidyltransferase [Tissierellia bacterium]